MYVIEIHTVHTNTMNNVTMNEIRWRSTVEAGKKKKTMGLPLFEIETHQVEGTLLATYRWWHGA